MFKSLKFFFNIFRKTDIKSKPSEKDILKEQISKSTNDFINRPIYKVLTEEILDITPDDDLIQVVFDNICEKFPKEYSKQQATFLTFSKYRQAFYAIWYLEAEANNGGFNQYYANPSGEFASLLPEALMLIGANKFAELLSRANFIYETENEMITRFQDGTIEGFSKSYDDNPLNARDEEFFDLYKTENLFKLQIEFIRKNKTEFTDK